MFCAVIIFGITKANSVHVGTCGYSSVFRIEAKVFIFYKWLLTRHLYEPLLHFTWFRVLNRGFYWAQVCV